MEQFSLDKWLKDKSRKVTTRLGNREVRIICWNRKNNSNRPVITLMIDPDGNEYTTFHTKNGFVDEKEKYIDKRDLFFADEEEELTEFEKQLGVYIYFPKLSCEFNEEEKKYIKDAANTLLNLARKELGLVDNTCGEYVLNEAYKQGKQDALKDLPKWKKAKENRVLDWVVKFDKDGKIIVSDIIYKGEYFIMLKSLEILSKEE